MSEPAVAVRVHPGEHPLAGDLVSSAQAAAAHLALGRWLARIELILDDLAADERTWFSLPQTAVGRVLELYLHPDAILSDRFDSRSHREVFWTWTMSPAPPDPDAAEPGFSPAKAQRLLHHQFLWVRDLCDGTLDPAAVPVSLAEAFQEAWSVTVDGRLRRAGLPGLNEGQRRLRFLRAFVTGGVITPAHWQIFHELWQGDPVQQNEVLRRVRRLPRLPRGIRPVS